MRTLTLGLALLFVPFSLSAQSDPGCTGVQSLASLHAVRDAMVASGASSYEVARTIDEQLHLLRGPQANGSYRWVLLARPAGDAPVVRREKLVHATRENEEVDTFEARAATPFSVAVVVPRKRSILRGNNAVWIGEVRIEVESEGERDSVTHAVNDWLRPDTTRTFDLGVIADSATVEIEAATDSSSSGEALVEVHFMQAVTQDDPLNPEARGVQALERIRADTDPEVVDYELAVLEREVLGATRSIPFATTLARIVEAEALMKSEKEEERTRGLEILQDVVKDLRY